MSLESSLSEWRGLSFAELDLAATLSSGQVFRWRCDASGTWTGHVGAAKLQLAQSDDGTTLFYEGDRAVVQSFLRLDELSLTALAEPWCAADRRFAEAWARQPGVRILRQDPHECFFSFLCASVAPIKRISGMLRAVTEAATGDAYGPFPSIAQLSTLSEVQLRALGLGFRAVRVAEAAQNPIDLMALRGRPLNEIEAALTQFHGVGRKIADCVALFSLDADDAVPVDTHIWRMTQNHYAKELAGASLTPANYTRAVQAFRDCFGDKCGWAQQVLFYQAAVA